MPRPLIISDCDEVLLHMIVPFQAWLDEAKHIHFDLDSPDFGRALRHKHDGTRIMPEEVWPLLDDFFTTEMHRQQPIAGAIEAMNALSQNADIVILTNLMDEFQQARADQLAAAGLHAPVYTNQGGKGAKIAALVAQYQPSVTIFIDDLAHNHTSCAHRAPDVWRLQMVGESAINGNIPPCEYAHKRIDDWPAARQWIAQIIANGKSPPPPPPLPPETPGLRAEATPQKEDKNA